MVNKMFSIKIPESEDGSRIDRCVRRILGNINQAVLEKYLRSGLILLDNKKTKSSFKVCFGQFIKYSSFIDFENKKIQQYTNEDTQKYYQNLYKEIFIQQTQDYIAINKKILAEAFFCFYHLLSRNFKD